MRYFSYVQNNSGGFYEGPAITVIVEAETPEGADASAESVGVYFDPDCNIDCECCGSRWSSCVDWDDGHEEVEDAFVYLGYGWVDDDNIKPVMFVRSGSRKVIYPKLARTSGKSDYLAAYYLKEIQEAPGVRFGSGKWIIDERKRD